MRFVLVLLAVATLALADIKRYDGYEIFAALVPVIWNYFADTKCTL